MPTPVRTASASLVDPEDDLPSDTYAGDFETTLIPHYDSNDSGSVRSSSTGFGLIGGQEPLPYQPQPSGRHSAAAGLGQQRQGCEGNRGQPQLAAGFELGACPGAFVEPQPVDVFPTHRLATEQCAHRHAVSIGLCAKPNDQRRQDHRDDQ